MKSHIVNVVRRGFFLDSVALMRLSRDICEREGVEEAALMMGTPSNRKIMEDAGILTAEGACATGSDLVIGIRAVDRETAERAVQESAELLGKSPVATGAAEAWRPRTVAAAVKTAPDANLALISVAGEFAAAEARKALHAGLNVMIFSDNVPLSEEVALKEEARLLGSLVMGPDCGTAIIGGVPLGFANKVSRGDIGIVGATGTGMQEVSCLISRGGGGISQAIGVGGRDLKEEVGGISTLMAMDALEDDPGTRHIVLISKPPAPPVAARILEKVRASSKRFTVCFLGLSETAVPGNARLATTLKAAARSALGGTIAFGEYDPSLQAAAPSGGGTDVVGLFCGGTLCAEAQLIFLRAGQSLHSNVPVPGALRVGAAGTGHRFLDLGDDQYTVGCPHPMIDPTVRDRMARGTVQDPKVGVLLLDVVLGYGAHRDPAGHLVAALGNRRADRPVVIGSVVGTDDDPQDRVAQIRILEDAGIRVAPSNADAALLALACIRK
jgi:FdrA protein